jgi:hypothetical protein
LHLLLLSASETLAERVRELWKAMQEAYYRECVSREREWTQEDTDEYVRWIRLAWILHGREMINNAAEREWEGCVPLSAGPDAWSQCGLRRKMAEVGSWYVDVAGRDEREMASRWGEVRGEEMLGGLYMGRR